MVPRPWLQTFISFFRKFQPYILYAQIVKSPFYSRCWAFLQLFLLHHCSSSDILIQPSLLGNFEFPLSLTRDEPGLNLVTVSRTLSESGFHRTLLTEVSLPSEVVSNVRSVAIVENITSSQYVDIDQVQELLIVYPVPSRVGVKSHCPVV